MKLGIDFLDENISETELTDKMTLLLSRFAQGKTTFLIKTLTSFAKNDGKKVLYVNFDYSPRAVIKKIHHCLNEVPLGTELNKENLILTNSPIKIKYFEYGKRNDLIDYLKKHIDYDMIVVDGCEDQQIKDLIEFKKSFKNILLTSSHLKTFIGGEKKSNLAQGDINLLILQRDIHNDSSKISIQTETTNIFELDIDFDPRTFKLNKKQQYEENN